MYTKKTENETNSLKEYSIFTVMSKEEHHVMKTYFDELHLRFDANRLWNHNSCTMFFSCECSTNNLWQNMEQSLDSRKWWILLFFISCFCCLHTVLYLQFATECNIIHSFAFWRTSFSSAGMFGFINSI